MLTIENYSAYGKTFELGESIEADAESVRQAMLFEANNVREDKFGYIGTGICKDLIADRLEFYAKYLKFK